MMNFSRTQYMTEDNVEHSLFVEDLTKYVFRHHAGFPFNPVRGRCRQVVRVGFTDTVKKSVGCIEKIVAGRIELLYSEMSSMADTIWAFNKFASEMIFYAMTRGFNSYALLYISVTVVLLGERFCRAGNKHFHFLCVVAVRYALKMYHMYCDGWGAVESASDTIVTHLEELKKDLSVNRSQEQLHSIPHDIRKYIEDLLVTESQGEGSPSSGVTKDESTYSVRSIENGGTSSGTSGESQRSSNHVVASTDKPTQSNTARNSIRMKKISTKRIRAYKENSTDLPPPTRNDSYNINTGESSYSRSNGESGLLIPEYSPDCSTVPAKRRKSSKIIRKNATGKNSIDLTPLQETILLTQMRENCQFPGVIENPSFWYQDPPRIVQQHLERGVKAVKEPAKMLRASNVQVKSQVSLRMKTGSVKICPTVSHLYSKTRNLKDLSQTEVECEQTLNRSRFIYHQQK